MPNTDPSLPARHANGRFGPGNPGRPLGARGRASHKVVMSILDDFEAHKVTVLAQLRAHNRESYFTTLLRFLPPLISDEPPGHEACSEPEAAAMLARARLVLSGGADPREALAELQAVLEGGPGADQP
jgi:hypothetical protein